jgi:excisionase family DNA binding protein
LTKYLVYGIVLSPITANGIEYMKLLTAKQAAKILKVDDSRVRVLIREGRLPAQKVGRDWVIMEPDLELVRVRKPGRPKKQKGKGSTTAKRLPSNKELLEILKNDNKKVSQALKRFRNGEITREELNEVSRSISERTKELNRLLKEEQEARRRQK